MLSTENISGKWAISFKNCEETIEKCWSWNREGVSIFGNAMIASRLLNI